MRARPPENISAVASTWSGKETEFLVAGPDQVDDVLNLLDEAAAWLQARGISQWPERFESSWVEEAIRRGETRLVQVGGAISATVTLDWSDPAWSDVAGSAGYLHRMAVRRRASGLGAVILAWAADIACQRGRKALRLDCVASNERLRAYYEAAGFVHHGDVAVAGAPGQRLDTGPATLVSRYELQLDALPAGVSQDNCF
jgi:GNAT superfamily N-acetyltransferase